MGRVDVYRMTELLESECGVDHKTFGAAWRDVWQYSLGGVHDINAPIPRSGCRNAMRSCGLDMKGGGTCFPRLLVIATRVPLEVL